MAEAYQTRVRPEKVKVVEEIKERLDKAKATLLTEYRGLTVTELGTLRVELTKADVEYRVAKNTMTRIAAQQLGIDGLDPLCEGPTAIAYCYGDPVVGTKALATFAKDHPTLVIKGGVLEGRVMSADEAQGLATVDPLDVSLAKICGSLTAPLAAIVGTLEAPLRQILFVLEQGQATGIFAGADAAEAPTADAAEETQAPAEQAPAEQGSAPAGDASGSEEEATGVTPEAEESTTEESE